MSKDNFLRVMKTFVSNLNDDQCSSLLLKVWQRLSRAFLVLAGVALGVFRGGNDSSHEVAILQFLGYYECQKSPKK